MVEGVVDVAGLGVSVVSPCQIFGTETDGQLLDRRPISVVEPPRFVRRPDRHRGCDHREKNFWTLVVGRDQQSDSRGGDIHRVPVRRRVDVPQREGVQAEAGGIVNFEHEHRNGDEPGTHVDCEEDPPGQVDGAGGETEHRERADGALLRPGFRRQHLTIGQVGKTRTDVVGLRTGTCGASGVGVGTGFDHGWGRKQPVYWNYRWNSLASKGLRNH